MPKPADWNEVPRRLSVEVVADAKRCGKCHGLFAREDKLGGWIGECMIFQFGLSKHPDDPTKGRFPMLTGPAHESVSEWGRAAPKRVKGEWERSETCLKAERSSR